MSGKTTFLGGNGIMTGAGGLIAGGILSVFLYRSGMWSAQLASAVIAFRTMSECVLIMPGADITFLKGTYIAPLIVGIVLVCGYITYSGALKGLGRKVDLSMPSPSPWSRPESVQPICSYKRHKHLRSTAIKN